VRWDREVDVLVAGAGAAGMTAALVAAIEGLSVLLCEKSQQVGGTTATSAGTVWIPRDQEAARKYLECLADSSQQRPLREVYLRSAAAAIDDLAARSEVKFSPAGPHPDYREAEGAAFEGRALASLPFDGRWLGSDFGLVRPPIEEFMLLGGMMVAKSDIAPLVARFSSLGNFLHAARLVARYAVDRLRYPRGTRLVMGNALVARLFYSLRRNGVPILFQAPLTDLVRDGERVIGARVGDLRVKARRAIVLATGGYARNKAFRAAFMPASAPDYSLSSPEISGDGMAAARRLGAGVSGGHRSGGFWAPVSRPPRRDGSSGLFPHLILDRAKPGLIAVNAAGRRFVNEACSYHDFVEAMFESHKRVPTIPAFLVCDSEFVARYGLGAIHPGTRKLKRHEASGYIASAGSMGELARKLSIDAPALERTIERHNRFARLGEDPDFGKGSTVLNRFNGDPTRAHPCLAPIARPPFCAMKVWPADLGVSTGLVTDADARVLDEQGRPIPGLYTCGNDMASIFEGTYPGPGTTLGPALTFAYRAAMHAARQPLVQARTIDQSTTLQSHTS
jgi:succinate dehydrogenase/fumarate reductase flavoprotein subunit